MVQAIHGYTVLQYKIYHLPLKNKSVFSKVKVDEILETIVWENGADFAPEFLYFKSFENEKALEQQFIEWGYLNTIK